MVQSGSVRASAGGDVRGYGPWRFHWPEPAHRGPLAGQGCRVKGARPRGTVGASFGSVQHPESRQLRTAATDRVCGRGGWGAAAVQFRAGTQYDHVGEADSVGREGALLIGRVGPVG